MKKHTSRSQRQWGWSLLAVGLALSWLMLWSSLVARARTTATTVKFESDPYYILENGGTAHITVTLSAAATGSEVVTYTTRNGTAADCNDYTATSGQLHFTAGQTQTTFTVTVAADLDAESDESVQLILLSASGGATLGTSTTATLVILDEDQIPTVQYGAQFFKGSENSGHIVAVVTLSRPLTETFSIAYATVDGTAEAGSDYIATNGTLNFPAGVTTRTFSVPVLDDEVIFEGNETVNLTLNNPQPSYVLLSSSAASVLWITEESGPSGTPVVFFTSDNSQVYESAGGTAIGVALSATSTQQITVNYATSAGLAQPGADYVSTNGTLVFSPGVTYREFQVAVWDDATLELGGETLSLQLTNPQNATVDPNATLTIIDDENPLVVSLEYNERTVAESVGLLPVNVFLSTDYGYPVTATYSTQNGSAGAGSDYMNVNATVTFPPCATQVPVSVTVLDDVLDEPTEYFTLTLDSVTPSPAVGIGYPERTHVWIQDNDVPALFFKQTPYTETERNTSVPIQVSIEPRSTWQIISVDYVANTGSATPYLDYSPVTGTLTFWPNGATTHNFVVPVFDDALDEPVETVILQLNNLQASGSEATLSGTHPTTLDIYDDDIPQVTLAPAASYVAEGAGTVGLTATLDIAPWQALTVRYTTADATANTPGDYTGSLSGTLDFAAGQTTLAFTVPIIDDGADEPTEQFSVQLTGSATPGSVAVGSADTAAVNIMDNDVPRVQLSAATYHIAESAGTARLTATLDIPAWRDITVDYMTANQSAVAGEDYVASTGTTVITAGAQHAYIPVPLINDVWDENDETFIITLTQSTYAALGNPLTAQIIIEDDDELGIQFVTDAYTAIEGPGWATITVELLQSSTRSVTVTCTTHDGTALAGEDYTASSEMVIFPPGALTATFPVSITADGVEEWDETLHVQLSSALNGSIVGPNPATLTIIDNTPPPDVTFHSDPYYVGEASPTVDIRVDLSRSSLRPTTLTVQSENGTAAAPADYPVVMQELHFDPGATSQTLQVTVTDDDLTEGTEFFTLRATDPQNAAVSAASHTTVYITDNDISDLRFTTDHYTVTESQAWATMTVELVTVSPLAITVTYTTHAGTATAGTDYAASSGQLFFAPGAMTADFVVIIADDGIEELDETIYVQLSGAVNATIVDTNPVTLTIVDTTPHPK